MGGRYYSNMGAKTQITACLRPVGLTLAVLLLASAADADTVKLRSGKILTGKVVSQDPSGITLESSGQEQYILKRDIVAFREDSVGLEFSNKRQQEVEQAAAEREKQIEEGSEKLAPSYNGIWFGAGYAQGRLQTFQESLLQADRIQSNGINGAGTASVYSKVDNQRARGYAGYAMLRRESYYLEAEAYAFRSEGKFDQIGLPPITSIVQSTATTTNQIGDFRMKPARKQHATAVFAIRPASFSPRWQVFLLGGIVGDRTNVRLDADILTSATQRISSSFTLAANAFTRLRGFTSKLYGEGGIGGLDIRFRPGGGFELRAMARFSSIEGNFKGRGNLATGTSIYLPSSVFTSGSVSHFREDAVMYQRSADYTLTFYAPIGSRLRVFTTAGTEFTHARLMHRAALDISQNTTVQSFFQSGLGPYLTKLYSRPEHSGRLSRVVVGIEARI
ncbi:MAG: hypothetical protein JNM27_06505 [Leptospirales bacterium]|nr:hypothetical protein [Leptospirales bacterium]